MDLPGRVSGGAGGDVIQLHAHGQKLVHDVEHVFHAGVHAAGVEVGRDGVRQESLLHGGDGDPPGEAAAAVPDVEDHAAFAPFDHPGVQLSLIVELVPQAGEAVGVDVA